ncbi:MAG: hypothetical protein IKF16_07480 [Lachnospiraceae bacterium]|nr:hypothetical protein [Lachnospiraceae bacterium]
MLIQSPTLTADWEQKLVLIERGEYDPSAFMQEIEDMISTLVKTYEVVKGADVLMNGKKVMGACPHCGAEVMERQKVGNSVYHICQYAEILKQNGGRCAPEPETELAKAAWQFGHREYLMLERTDTGFRYEILTKDFLSRTHGQLDRLEWTMNQAREYVLDLAGLYHRSRFAVSYDMVKQKSRDVLKSSDVRNIEWVDSKYYPGMRTAEHTLTCKIHGEPFRLTYEVSKHDDGEGFVIHSAGKDIWDLMPEPELEKLEFTLSRAVTFGHWKKDIDQAEIVEAVRDVRYGIWETENLNLTRDQIRELHEMIDRKEETLTAAMKK